MEIRRVVGIMFALMTLLGQVGIAQQSSRSLTKRQRETLTEIVLPAYAADDLYTLSDAIPRILGAADEEQMEAIGAWCEENQVPELIGLLAESRYELALQGQSKGLSRLAPEQSIDVLKYFDGMLSKVAKRGKEFPNADEEVPKFDAIYDFRDYLWEMHVFDRELANHIVVAEYAAKIAKTFPKRGRRRLKPAQVAVLNMRFDEVANGFYAKQQALHEAEVEIRFNRLNYAVNTLGNEPQPKERMMAAYAVAIDSKMLGELFTAVRRQEESKKPRDVLPVATARFQRDLLNQPDLLERIAQQRAFGYELAGDLIEKSVLLFEGLRWWGRGRYGRGALAFGLLKPESATRSRLAMEAISMPVETPTPTEPAQESEESGEQTPEVDRRHHYLWSLEDRGFVESEVGSTVTTKKKLGQEKSDTDYFY